MRRVALRRGSLLLATGVGATLGAIGGAVAAISGVSNVPLLALIVLGSIVVGAIGGIAGYSAVALLTRIAGRRDFSLVLLGTLTASTVVCIALFAMQATQPPIVLFLPPAMAVALSLYFFARTGELTLCDLPPGQTASRQASAGKAAVCMALLMAK